jgi:glycosyltransferase involved in cell wall biosynthesis
MNTFNRAHLLRLALASYLRQSQGGFEVVVADDGSTDDTLEVVEAFRMKASFPVAYVRQEHHGHRRAAVLNRGIERCRHEQILFTDCDSLALSNLIEVHRRHARPERLLCGGYVRLSREATEALTASEVLDGTFEQLFALKGRLDVLRKHLEARWQIFLRHKRRPHNMGLNYSVPREALIRINGYDEEFEGWGAADGDVRERLRAAGVQPVSLYSKAVILHMWHPVERTKLDGDRLRRNREYAKRSTVPMFCRRGLLREEPVGAAAGASPPAPPVVDVAEGVHSLAGSRSIATTS